VDSSSSKDIILAVLGGSVSLAGLLLIFSGFLFSQAAGFDPDNTPDKIINRYRNAARFGVLPFLMCLATAGIAIWWLRSPSENLLIIRWIGFIALLVVTAVYGGYTILRYL
jgi:hypothetical protein